MTEEELDKFTAGRRVYNSFTNEEWKIDAIDGVYNLILLSNDLGQTTEMTLDYFNRHCFFIDELFDWKPRDKYNKCECGVDSVGYGIHSDYCPKYEGNK